MLEALESLGSSYGEYEGWYVDLARLLVIFTSELNEEQELEDEGDSDKLEILFSTALMASMWV